MYTSARAFGYLLFSVPYQGLDSGLCYTVLNFAVLIFLLFELNFASGKNLFFWRTVELLLVKKEFVSRFQIANERIFYTIITSNGTLVKICNLCQLQLKCSFSEQSFFFAALPLCLDVVRVLDKNIEIFPRSDFFFPSQRFQQCARAPRSSKSKQKKITIRLHQLKKYLSSIFSLKKTLSDIGLN